MVFIFLAFLLQTHLISDPSPLARSKAVKNSVEIEGMRQAHVSAYMHIIYMFYRYSEVSSEDLETLLRRLID